MLDKTLQLKTPLKNMVLILNGDTNRVTGSPEICVSLGRATAPYAFHRSVFAWDQITNCYLSMNAKESDCTLWVGRTSFDVCVGDADLIATTFSINIDRR